MSEKYPAECVICGVEKEFTEPAQLQWAICKGEPGEYVCSPCLEEGEGLMVDE